MKAPRISQILTAKLIASEICVAVYCAGWVWTERQGFILLWEDFSKWYALIFR
jgi:hypothetical protein